MKLKIIRIKYEDLTEFSVLMLIILAGHVNSAIYKLNNYTAFPNLDESLWHLRSKIFIDKITQFDFSGLIQSLQPGITVYWLAGFMMKLIPEGSYDFDVIRRIIKMANENNVSYNLVINLNNEYLYDYSEKASLAFNLPLFFTLTVFFICFYYLLKKIGFNNIIAYLSVFFISANAFLAFYTTPSDKLLIVFMILSFLTYLVYMDNEKKKRYLMLSAFFGALAVLSKLTALFIAPFYFLAHLYYKFPSDKKGLAMLLKDIFLWMLIFIGACIIFLPTIIFHPDEVYNFIFNSGKTFDKSFEGAAYVKRTSEYASLFQYAVTHGLIALQVFSLIFSLIIIAIYRKGDCLKETAKHIPKKHLITILCFISIFILFVTIMSGNHDIRQLSPAFAMLNIIIAAGLYGAISVLIKKLNIRNEYIFSFAIIALAVFQMGIVIYNGTLFKLMIKYYTGQMD